MNPMQKYPHIICLYFKYVCFYVFMHNKFLISSGTCSTPTLSKQIISIFELYKAIQWGPTSAYSSRFITYAHPLLF